MVRLLLELGSALLPTAHRARWREESLALLMEVDDRRRRRYTADILLKLPLLAWQAHRGPGAGWPRPGAVLAGAGLLFAALIVVSAMTLTAVLGEDNAEGLLVLAPFALAPFITRQAIRSRCGRFTTAVVIIFGAFGPLVAVVVLATGRLAPPALQPVITFLGYSVTTGPAVWLAVTSWLAVRRREQPVPMHVVGLVAGTAFGVLIVALIIQILSSGSPPALVLAVMVLALFVFLATFLLWAVWAGLRQIVVPERRAAAPTG